jgi:prepilin-type N-terminal cleavage/methylation domain-containing protein
MGNQAGFTLIEIAIVMVIIGLLIGGVLKGQEMINNAKVKRVVKQADELRAAVMTFYDKYGQYPGDKNSAVFPPGSAHNGNNDGHISAAEAPWVFNDLMLASLISGTYTGAATSLPTHPFGGTMSVQWFAAPISKHRIVCTLMPAAQALEIDSKYDDGVWNTGSILGSAVYTPGNLVTLYIDF